MKTDIAAAAAEAVRGSVSAARAIRRSPSAPDGQTLTVLAQVPPWAACPRWPLGASVDVATFRALRAYRFQAEATVPATRVRVWERVTLRSPGAPFSVGFCVSSSDRASGSSRLPRMWRSGPCWGLRRRGTEVRDLCAAVDARRGQIRRRARSSGALNPNSDPRAARGRPHPSAHAKPDGLDILYGPKRKRQTAAFAERHYGMRTYRLRERRVIVLQTTGTRDAEAAHA